MTTDTRRLFRHRVVLALRLLLWLLMLPLTPLLGTWEAVRYNWPGIWNEIADTFKDAIANTLALVLAPSHRLFWKTKHNQGLDGR